MNRYTDEQIQDALQIIERSIISCEKVRPKLKAGSSSFSLNTHRLRALYLSGALLKNQSGCYAKEELEQAAVQIASIKSKSTTGMHNAKEGSAAHTRFCRLISAMDIVLDYLQNTIDACR